MHPPQPNGERERPLPGTFRGRGVPQPVASCGDRYGQLVALTDQASSSGRSMRSSSSSRPCGKRNRRSFQWTAPSGRPGHAEAPHPGPGPPSGPGHGRQVSQDCPRPGVAGRSRQGCAAGRQQRKAQHGSSAHTHRGCSVPVGKGRMRPDPARGANRRAPAEGGAMGVRGGPSRHWKIDAWTTSEGRESTTTAAPL